METNYKNKIQEVVISILKSVVDKPLSELSEDNCSEMSRLIGYLILDDLNFAKALILKGNISASRQHDILLVDVNGQYSLIDPTIWQIKKEAVSIFLGEFKSVEDAIEFASLNYNGKWILSEALNSADSKIAKKDCLSIIQKNLSELV